MSSRPSLRVASGTTSHTNIYAHSSFGAAPLPSQPNLTSQLSTPGLLSGSGTSTNMSMSSTSPPASTMPLSAVGGMKTRSSLRGTISTEAPPDLITSSSTIDSTPIEFTIIRTKEDDDEDAKLKEKEKNMTWDDKRKLDEHLILVREEVLSTEQTYVEKLLTLEAAWIQPLVALTPQELIDVGISATQRATLLSNLAVIIGFQEKFYKDLKSAGPHRVEEVIIQYSHFFRLYSKYATDYQSMAETLTALTPSKKWAAFTTMVNTKLGAFNGNELLMSFLIMPIQRIPRYELLLREMKRATLPSAPEFETISRALGLIKQTATHVNAAKKEAENMAALLDIQRKIKGEITKDLQLVQPHRRYVDTVTVQLSEPKASFFSNKKTALRTFFLFNDVMVWTNIDNEYKSFVNIASITEINLQEPYAIEISSSQKFLQLDFCTDKTPYDISSEKGRDASALRQQWYDLLYTLVEEAQASRQRQRHLRQKDSGTHKKIVGHFATLSRSQAADASLAQLSEMSLNEHPSNRR